jgi:hypothetical protein
MEEDKGKVIKLESDCEECEDCPITDEEAEMFLGFLDELMTKNFCPDCGMDFILRIFGAGVDKGWENHKDYMYDCLDDEDE